MYMYIYISYIYIHIYMANFFFYVSKPFGINFLKSPPTMLQNDPKMTPKWYRDTPRRPQDDPKMVSNTYEENCYMLETTWRELQHNWKSDLFHRTSSEVVWPTVIWPVWKGPVGSRSSNGSKNPPVRPPVDGCGERRLETDFSKMGNFQIMLVFIKVGSK